MENLYSRFAWDVFVSYTHLDEEIVTEAVQKLKALLSKHNITIYFDQLDKPLEHDHGLGTGLSEGLASCKLFLVFLSENYLTRPWCLAEAFHFFKNAGSVASGREYVDGYFLGLPLNETFIPVFMPPDIDENEEFAEFFMFKVLPLWDDFRLKIIDNPLWPDVLDNPLSLSFTDVFILDQEHNNETLCRLAEVIQDRMKKSVENLNNSYKADGEAVRSVTPEKLWEIVFTSICSDHWARNQNIAKILEDFEITLDETKVQTMINDHAENALVALFDSIHRRIPFIHVLNFVERSWHQIAQDNPDQYHNINGAHFLVAGETSQLNETADPHSIDYIYPDIIEGNPITLLFQLAKQANIVTELQASYYQYRIMRPKDPLVDCSLLAAMLVSDDMYTYQIFSCDTFKNDVLERIKNLEPITIC